MAFWRLVKAGVEVDILTNNFPIFLTRNRLLAMFKNL